MNPISIQPSADIHPSHLTGMPTISHSGVANRPLGLEYLASIDQLLVRQKFELYETFIGEETKNKFDIQDSAGQNIFLGFEDGSYCSRLFFGSYRTFHLRIFDTNQTEVLHLERPLACDLCCFPCWLQTMQVSASPGQVIGRIEQVKNWFHPLFVVKNKFDETVLRIEGSFFQSWCGGDVQFKILSMEGDEIGNICKKWTGLARGMFSDADFFSINFPIGLAVELKAILLGACILIDVIFFENNNSGGLLSIIL